MDEIERYQHLLHARLPAFKRKAERTQAIIEEALSKPWEEWYIAFSGGVDSTVLFHLVQSVYSDFCPTLFGDDGFDFPETLQFLKDTEAFYDGDTPIQRMRCMQPWRDWCIEMNRPDLASDPAALEAWGNPHRWHDTWDSLKDARQHGYSGVFLGLLASESRSRGYALRDGRNPLYQVKSEQGTWHCSPLATWEKRDVWAYVVSRDIPYNPVYDRLAELGVPLGKRRCAPLTCFRVMQYGSHAILKAGWHSLYNQITATFPEVRSYG